MNERQGIVIMLLIWLFICGVLTVVYLIEKWKEIQNEREAGTL